MRETTELYKEIVASGDYEVETRLSIGGAGASGSLRESDIWFIHTNRRLFATETPTIGGCVAGEITAEIFMPDTGIPRMAELRIYTRVRTKDGTKVDTEWIRKGTFFVDTRKLRKRNDGRTIATLTGYDAMLRSEQDYEPPSDITEWPAADIDVLNGIADQMGVSLDSRTKEIVTRNYPINLPTGYSCREVLSCIAAAYGGNFIMSDLGQLLLVQLNNVPRDEMYLVDESGQAITFGGVAILV